MVCFSKETFASLGGQDMPQEASILNLMCEIWNQAHLRRNNCLISKMDADFNIVESLSWDDMKARLEQEKERKQKNVKFTSTAGIAALNAVNNVLVQVVCVIGLTAEETAKVKFNAKSENSNLNGQLEIAKGTHLKIPLSLAEMLQFKIKLLKYPSGYEKKARSLILESLTVFNLNDVHPAFYTLGQKLADITKEEELIAFLNHVRDLRFETLIQCIAHDEEIPDTGISANDAETLLCEEEKEVLREWKEDIMRVHSPMTDFGFVEKEFMERYEILDA